MDHRYIVLVYGEIVIDDEAKQKTGYVHFIVAVP